MNVRLSCESITPLGGPVVPDVYTRWQHKFGAKFDNLESISKLIINKLNIQN